MISLWEYWHDDLKGYFSEGPGVPAKDLLSSSPDGYYASHKVVYSIWRMPLDGAVWELRGGSAGVGPPTFTPPYYVQLCLFSDWDGK